MLALDSESTIFRLSHVHTKLFLAFVLKKKKKDKKSSGIIINSFRRYFFSYFKRKQNIYNYTYSTTEFNAIISSFHFVL